MGAGPSDGDAMRPHETTSYAGLMRLVVAFLHRCVPGSSRNAHAVMRRTRISATIPEHASARAAVRGSQGLPPVSGSGRADAEALAVALAEGLAEALALALAEAFAVAPVLALSCTRSTSRLPA